MVLPAGFEPATVLTSRDALSGAGYKPEVLPIELREHEMVPSARVELAKNLESHSSNCTNLYVSRGRKDFPAFESNEIFGTQGFSHPSRRMSTEVAHADWKLVPLSELESLLMS